MGILLPILLIAIACLIIWRAGDGFMAASEYIGRNLSDGVRGATINAIASSMPEVFTSLFFLFILQDAEGFSGGIGTAAGSAIFNGMVIPSMAVLGVIYGGLAKRIKISKKVLLRDGIALVICEILFIVVINRTSLNWYHGMFLMVVYLFYLAYTLIQMKRGQRKAAQGAVASPVIEVEEEEEVNDAPRPSLFKGIFTLDFEAVFIGNAKINNARAYPLLVISTVFIALVCYLLVVACEWIGEDQYVLAGQTFYGLGIPVMFVALILASAASSFPDTIISIKDAQRGQYDDAISNALGSNIFDICFSLGFPLFLFTFLNGPIEMTPELIDQTSQLQALLVIYTVIIILMFTLAEYVGKVQSYILLTLYALFVVYIVGLGYGHPLAEEIAEDLAGIVHFFLGRAS